MKNILIISILLSSFFELNAQTNSHHAILSGEIKNSEGEQVIIRDNLWEAVDTLQLKDGQFRDTLMLPHGYYYLEHEEAQIRLYLTVGMDLTLNLDLKDIVHTTSWKGRGQNENNYLASKFRLTQSIPSEKRMYSEYAQLGERDFLAQTDSIYQLYVIHYRNNKNDLDQTFAYLDNE